MSRKASFTLTLLRTFGRPFRAFKSTKSGHPASSLAAGVLDAAAASVAPDDAVSAEDETPMDPISAVNIVQDSSTTPSGASAHASFLNFCPVIFAFCTALGHALPSNADQGRLTTHSGSASPPLEMDANFCGSMAPVPEPDSISHSLCAAIESGPLPKINQSLQLDANEAQNKFNEHMGVILDGLVTGMTVANEASNWNPLLKSVLGGIVAVVGLTKTVHNNWKDMQVTVECIEGLLPILVTSELHLNGCKDGFKREDKLMTFAKRVLQGTKDADALLGIYKNIAEALEQFKLLSVIQVQSEQ
ncbi:hypothetical protein H0H92_015598 [Tricholoma furcatifolium]|nr:hypothetical protein H0H92_015598 [Tricholoma furcatifolium]